jgi:hypothetical protein
MTPDIHASIGGSHRGSKSTTSNWPSTRSTNSAQSAINNPITA